MWFYDAFRTDDLYSCVLNRPRPLMPTSGWAMGAPGLPLRAHLFMSWWVARAVQQWLDRRPLRWMPRRWATWWWAGYGAKQRSKQWLHLSNTFSAWTNPGWQILQSSVCQIVKFYFPWCTQHVDICDTFCPDIWDTGDCSSAPRAPKTLQWS